MGLNSTVEGGFAVFTLRTGRRGLQRLSDDATIELLNALKSLKCSCSDSCETVCHTCGELNRGLKGSDSWDL